MSVKPIVHLIAAARPNFMKVAPLYKVLSSQGWCNPVLVHTGQHYETSMSGAFFKDFGLPEPDYNLGIGGGTHAQQVGRLMMVYEGICEEKRPDITVVVGDVNATMSVAITAAKMSIPIAHVESGLRSFDRAMPEEINRVVTDSITDLFFTPSPDADENLLREGIPQAKIKRVGNIMIDSYCLLEDKISSQDLELVAGLEKYGVVTLHRPSNVDDKDKLHKIVAMLEKLSNDVPLVLPLHPRTRKNLKEAGLFDKFQALPHIRVTEPMNYISFMSYVRKAAFVLTDSGGVQEETTYLGVPCLTLRDNTERPITISQGTNVLVNIDTVAAEVEKILAGSFKTSLCPEFWDGKTAERIASVLKQALGQ